MLPRNPTRLLSLDFILNHLSTHDTLFSPPLSADDLVPSFTGKTVEGVLPLPSLTILNLYAPFCILFHFPHDTG